MFERTDPTHPHVCFSHAQEFLQSSKSSSTWLCSTYATAENRQAKLLKIRTFALFLSLFHLLSFSVASWPLLAFSQQVLRLLNHLVL